MRRLTSGVATAYLLAAVGCSSPSVERRDSALKLWPDRHSSLRAAVLRDNVMLIGLPTAVVGEAITLERVEFVGAPSTLLLVDARVSFVACPRCRRRPGFVGVNGTAGTVCIGSFPPHDFGPTYPLLDLELAPGDAPSLLLYVKATRPGSHMARGYRVHFRTVAGTRYVAESGHLDMTVVRSDDQPAAAGSQRCEGPGDSIWTGGEKGPQVIIPLD